MKVFKYKVLQCGLEITNFSRNSSDILSWHTFLVLGGTNKCIFFILLPRCLWEVKLLTRISTIINYTWNRRSTHMHHFYIYVGHTEIIGSLVLPVMLDQKTKLFHKIFEFLGWIPFTERRKIIWFRHNIFLKLAGRKKWNFREKKFVAGSLRFSKWIIWTRTYQPADLYILC